MPIGIHEDKGSREKAHVTAFGTKSMDAVSSVFGRISIRGPATMYAASAVIGLVSGLGATLFSKTLHLAEGIFYADYIGDHLATSFLNWPREFNGMLLFALVIGGLVNGLIAHFFCPEIRGSGVDYLIARFHRHEGRMRGRVAIFKSIATVFTLAGGGSAGKEGPAAQIGAGFSAFFANRLNIGARARRTLLLAGAAAGLGAIFHAPLAGALTAVEMIYKEDLESDAIVPCIIASIVSYLVSVTFSGAGPLYAASDLHFQVTDVPAYIVLGFVCFLAGFVFVRVYGAVFSAFTRLPVHPILKPLIGAIFVFAIALVVPRVTGSSSEVLQTMFNREAKYESADPLNVLVFFSLLTLSKILATSFTVGSGSAGGLYGPSLLIGASLGLSVAALQRIFIPGLEVSYVSFALVGMGAFYSGIASAPIAAIIFVCELVGNYVLLPPLMIVSIITLVLSHRWSIYSNQVTNRFESPAHHWDMRTDLLEKITIESSGISLRRLAVVPHTITLKKLKETAASIHATDFVVSDSNQYFGMVSLKHPLAGRPGEQVSAYVDTRIVPLHSTSSLATALKLMVEAELDKVAVVSPQGLLGYVRYKDIIDYYFKHIEKKGRSSPV